MRIYLAYFQSLLRHKWFVVKAGLSVGVPLWRLIMHDWSKFTPTEIVPYARWHFGGDKDRQKWAIAWHHHLLLNPHHPEHWLLSWRGDPGFYDGIGEFVASGVVVLPMPEVFVREMIADFLASSRTYTGCWNIANWLNENGPKMILHSETVRSIAVVMRELGYVSIDNRDWSWLKSCESETRLGRR